MLTTNEKLAGGIHVSRKSSLTHYSINCYLEKPCRVNCALLDKQGVTIWEQNSSQPKGQSSIDMQLPTLDPGEYNCWIKIDGNMHLRPITIDGIKRKGLFGQLMNHFS